MCTLVHSLLYSVNKNVSILIFHPEPARSITCFLSAIRIHCLHCPIGILATLGVGSTVQSELSLSIYSSQRQFQHTYPTLYSLV